MIKHYDVINTTETDRAGEPNSLLTENIIDRFKGDAEQEDSVKKSESNYYANFITFAISSLAISLSLGSFALNKYHSKSIAVGVMLVAFTIGFIASILALKRARSKMTHNEIKSIKIQENLPALREFFDDFVVFVNKEEKQVFPTTNFKVDIKPAKEESFRREVDIEGDTIVSGLPTKLTITLGFNVMYSQLTVMDYQLHTEAVD